MLHTTVAPMPIIGGASRISRARGVKIDQAFGLKYRAIEAGQPFDILSCTAQWDRLYAD